MGREISDRTQEQMKKLNALLLNGDLEQNKVCKLLGLSDNQYYNFMCTMTYIYPIFEYQKNNKTFIGILRK